MSKLYAVVMAAGHGTRMKSSLPKVLHPACGRPLVYYPVRAALELGADQVVVVVNPTTRAAIAASLEQHLPEGAVSLAVQQVPQGTGDAVRAGASELPLQAGDRVLILSGDTPLLDAADLRPLLQQVQGGTLLSFMTFVVAEPTGYGRVLRELAADGSSTGRVKEIREHKDLRNDAERAVDEVNAGVYLAEAAALQSALAQLNNDNAQGEYYLTDIVPHIAQLGDVTTHVASVASLAGVNDRQQLREVESLLFERIRNRWCKEGVSISGTPLIDDTVQLECDVRLEDGVRLRGNTRIGSATFVDVGCVITDSKISEGALLKPYCVVTESIVEDGVQLGPYAHLRPGSYLEKDCHIGNFVETKNTRVKQGAKANHLAYLGDAEIGEKANLGAGTIICNYDGFQKQRTIVGKGAFIGSDSQLVAPVRVGDGAYVGTGTTVTEDVPDDALAIGRVRQVNKLGYGAQLRERLRAAAAAKKSAP